MGLRVMLSFNFFSPPLPFREPDPHASRIGAKENIIYYYSDKNFC